MNQKQKKMTKPKANSLKPTVDKITSYRATSADGKIQANGSSEKEALENLKKAQNNND